MFHTRNTRKCFLKNPQGPDHTSLTRPLPCRRNGGQVRELARGDPMRNPACISPCYAAGVFRAGRVRDAAIKRCTSSKVLICFIISLENQTLHQSRGEEGLNPPPRHPRLQPRPGPSWRSSSSLGLGGHPRTGTGGRSRCASGSPGGQ